MATIYFVTNRNPEPNVNNPTDFGPHFSAKGIDDLRFGKANVTGSGKNWRWKLKVAKEKITTVKRERKLGSLEIFGELQESMKSGVDTLVFIHGYNVSFGDALISAAQLMGRWSAHPLNIVLFTWPSDGNLLRPDKLRKLYAYKNDRSDAKASGPAFARAVLKASDFLREITRRDACGAKIHLLAHSMGNYVLRNAVHEVRKHITGQLPRVFEQVFLMAADEDHDAFEHDHKFKVLPQLATTVNVYYNHNDVALVISDKLKFNPARLGSQGPQHPRNVPGNVNLINASEALRTEKPYDRTGHGYFAGSARVASDAIQVLNGIDPDEIDRRRYIHSLNQYVLL